MPDDSSAIPTRLSASEFLSVLERSDVLPAAKMREVHDRLWGETDHQDPAILAHQLVEEGTLTEFQAVDCWWGKRALPSDVMSCSTTSAREAGAGCSRPATA